MEEAAATKPQPKPVVMFDLDGCLSDHEWRLNLIPADPKEQKDWDVYHQACDKDDPLVHGSITLKSHLEAGHIILFTTARPASVADKTSAWLTKHFGISPNEHFSILMRQDGDTQPSLSLKRKFGTFVLENNKQHGNTIVAAYDDIPEIVDAYRELGINACVLNKDGIQIWEPKNIAPAAANPPPPLQPQPEHKKNVAEYLYDAAQIFGTRNAVYKDGYKRAGDVYRALFPDGMSLKTSEDFNRFTLVMMLVAKLTRYSFNFAAGGHPDSLDDMAVYAMMLKELDAK